MGWLPKELRKVEEALVAQGWTFRQSKKGVWAVPPEKDRSMVMWHHTPSSRHAATQFVAELKRQGFLPPE